MKTNLKQRNQKSKKSKKEHKSPNLKNKLVYKDRYNIRQKNW